MSSRPHPEFGPASLVLLVVTFVVAAHLSPPDPSAQLRYAAAGVILSALVAGLLKYGGGSGGSVCSPPATTCGWSWSSSPSSSA